MGNSSSMVGQLPFGVTAAADLSAKQYYLVKLAAASTVNLTGAGDVAAGVLINKPASGEAASVFALGFGQVICDGNAAAISRHDPLKSDANGKAVKADTADDHVIGWSFEASSANGDVIWAFIIPGSLAVTP